MEDDLRSPSSSSINDQDDEDVNNNSKAHSFRERRLTYTRHHVLSDNAAAQAEFAVVKNGVLAGGDTGVGLGQLHLGTGPLVEC